MKNLIDMNFNFNEYIAVEENEIFLGENSLQINDVGMIICEEIFKKKSTIDIIKTLHLKYPMVEQKVIIETTENFLLSIWKQGSYLEKENDIDICRLHLNVDDCIVVPSFIDFTKWENLPLNFNNHSLIDNLFKEIAQVQEEFKYNIFCIAIFDDKGFYKGYLNLETTRFTNTYSINSMYGDFTIEYIINNKEKIKSCIFKYFSFFGKVLENFEEIELLYIYDDNKLIQPLLNPIGRLRNEIGMNDLFIYSQII